MIKVIKNQETIDRILLVEKTDKIIILLVELGNKAKYEQPIVLSNKLVFQDGCEVEVDIPFTNFFTSCTTSRYTMIVTFVKLDYNEEKFDCIYNRTSENNPKVTNDS